MSPRGDLTPTAEPGTAEKGTAEPATSRARRLGDVLTRHPWIAYLALTPFPHPSLETLLFGERALQTAHDVFDNDVPRLFSIAEDWRRFGPSLWDPHLTSGNALLAQFALPPLAPDVLLSFVLPPFVAYTVNSSLMAFLAGLAMHLFLRDSLRLASVACFAGGVLSIFAIWTYILGYAVVLLPLALLWTERAVSPERRPRDVIGLALLVAFMAFSSLVQIVALVAAIALAWVILTTQPGREAVRRAIRFVVPWLVGALVAAPVLLTVGLAVEDSQRTLWRLDQPASVLRAWLGQLAFIPLGIEVRGLARGPSLFGSWFPGVIGLPLLLASFVIPREGRREKAILWLLVGLLVVDLVALVIIPLQAGAGFLGSFQFVRVGHLVPPLIVMNVAIAIAWLSRPGAVGALGRRRSIVLVVLVGAALLALAPQGLVIARHVLGWLRDGAPLLDLGQRQVAWLLGATAFAVGGLTLVAVGAAAFRRRRSWQKAGALGGAALLLVAGLAVERGAFTRADLLLARGIGTWADRVAPTAAQSFIAAQPRGGRVLSVVEHANRSLVAGLNAVDGYETVYPVRYHALFGALIRPQLDASRGLATYFGEWGSRAYAFSPEIRKPVADLLGVRWLYVAPESAIDPLLRRRYPPQGQVDPAFERRFDADGVVVYENPNAFPRAFVVHELASHPDRAAAIAAIDDATSEELRTRAYLVAGEAPGLTLPSLAPAGPAGPVRPDPADTATFVLDTPDRVQLSTHTERPGVLVLADTYARGWVASIDGRETPLFPVDVALRGVALPAGDHVVAFEYRPVETIVGFGLSLITALGLLAWLALPWLRRPRRA